MSIFNFDVVSFITNVGLWGVFGVVFAESSLIFFLPGDSLLFVAGLLASQDFYNLWYLVLGVFVAAIVGNNLGYALGHRFGRRIFSKEKSLLFSKDHVTKAEHFYNKYGSMTIILARFVPFARTFAPIIAGIAKMNYSLFMVYNIVGAFLWTISLCVGGFYLGKIVPDIDKYILPIVGVILIFSVAPPVYGYLRSKARAKSTS